MKKKYFIQRGSFHPVFSFHKGDIWFSVCISSDVQVDCLTWSCSLTDLPNTITRPKHPTGYATMLKCIQNL